MMGFLPDYQRAEVCVSPNFGERAEGCIPTILLLHYTGMKTGQEAQDWLCVPESQVSSHYLVHEDGRVVQMVQESKRAWHAGISVWANETDINSRSIGIEIVNGGHPAGMPDFPSVQIQAVIELCRDCVERHQISPERILAHSDVAPSRKIDPGEKFPWQTLHEQGIGHWVEPSPIGGGRYFQRGEAGAPIEALQSMLSLYGYGIEITGEYCAATEGVVSAFQRHFRPAKVDGVADSSTIETLHRLLSALPRYR